MDKSIGRGLAILGVLLALGMSIGAFILGVQAKQIGSAKQTITVKGVAEKPIDSTSAEWQITLNARADSFADALAQIKQEKPAMQNFLKQFGFDGEQVMFDAESVTPHMVDERDDRGYSVSVQRGFNASQTLHIKTNDLAKIQEARAKIIEYQAQGHDLNVSDVDFLVGNLDDIKLALIGEATKTPKPVQMSLPKMAMRKSARCARRHKGHLTFCPRMAAPKTASAASTTKVRSKKSRAWL